MPQVLTTVYQGSAVSGSVTRTAAEKVAHNIGATHYEWSIAKLVEDYVAIINGTTPSDELNWDRDDLTLQNIQARSRAPGIWMIANRYNKQTEELKAYITKEIEIAVPKAKFDTEESFDQLLSTTYNGKKSSLLVSSVIKKNSISVTGLTPGYLKLFTITYDENGINAEYSVPKAMLPPINQVLLDIMLSYKSNLNNDLPKEFRIIDKGNERTISYVDITKMRKVIYKMLLLIGKNNCWNQDCNCPLINWKIHQVFPKSPE